MNFWSNPGYCLTCCAQVIFIARQEWLRDHYVCSGCGSIPRERALIAVLEDKFPAWKDLVIHESSPGGGASARLRRDCKNYIPSHYIKNVVRGSYDREMLCVDMEALPFADESIDLHITQDVFEHLFHPDKAFLEIARTLKPGGAHLFTVPLVNKNQRSLQHAALRPDGTVDHRMPATYHDDPIGPQSALVTFHWGYDICDYILNATGLATSIFTPDDLSRGLRAEYIDVLMTIKPDPSPKATDLAAVSD